MAPLAGRPFPDWSLLNPDRSVRLTPREANMSWKVEVVVDDSGEWVRDPLRFETEQEALAYARDLEFRCSAIRDKRMVKSEDPPHRSN